MKTIILVLPVLLILSVHIQSSFAQANLEDSEPEQYFDFWLGEWDLTWEDADGTEGKGTNHIEWVLDDKVIKENFKAHTGAYKGFIGKSYSVYKSRTGEWKQTWVDNSGGYLDFTGKFTENKRIFKRKGVDPQGEEILQRMVFYDITENSLTWDWEKSEDKGQTWQLQWRIYYERAEEK